MPFLNKFSIIKHKIIPLFKKVLKSLFDSINCFIFVIPTKSIGLI